MKFQSLILFGLVAVTLNAANSNAEVKKECPVDMKAEFGKNNKCLCYPALKSIICEEIKEAFVLKNTYELGSLILKNINNLPNLIDKFHKDKKLVVDSLIILNEASPTGFKLPSMDDLEELFSISTSAIKIISTKDTKTDLDVSKLSPKMKSIVIQNANTLSGFDINSFPNLEHLVIQNVKFENKMEMQLHRSTYLKYLEISGSVNFVSLYSFKPALCADEKTQIKLTNNENMKYFDFTQLFVSNCKYHIDLSDNTFNGDILSTQLPAFDPKDAKFQEKLKEFNKKLDQLYVVMRDSPVTCNCNILNVLNQRPKNFHSIECSNVQEGGNMQLLSDYLVKAKFDPLVATNKDFKDCKVIAQVN